MYKAISFLLAVGSLAAQTVDLNGAWKWHSGDDRRFAERRFDDSAWVERQLPRRSSLTVGISWFRRQAIAPPESGSFTLVTGAASNCYDVFVNGMPIGGTGCVEGQDPPVFLPRAYPIPPDLLEPGRPFVVAIRANGRPHWSPLRWMYDEGPYLLSTPAQAAQMVELGHLRLIDAGLPIALMSVASMGIALLLLGLWASNRQLLELLWFGVFLLLVSWFNISNYRLLGTGGQSHPTLSWVIPLSYIFFTFGVYDVLFGRTIPVPLAAGIAVLTLGFRLFLPIPLYVLPSLAAPAVWSSQKLWRGTRQERYWALAVILYPLMAFNNLIIMVAPAWPISTSHFYVGSYFVNGITLVNLLLAVVLLLLLLWRLIEGQRDKQRLAGELQAGRTIQRLLMPGPALLGAFAVDAVYEPARELGGDFYQIVDREDGSRIVLVGDVSGKGLEAALVAAVVVGAFRRGQSDSPAALLAGLNGALIGQGRTGFVTCCCAHFESDGRATFANAGHPAPYRDGREVELEAGLPLGVAADAEYIDTPLILLPGEQVTLVSDGIVEAANASGELFGFDRTREISGKSAQEIADAAKAWGQNDDITVVTVRRSN